MRKKVRQGRGKEGWGRRMGKKARRKEREELEGEICEEEDKKLSCTFFTSAHSLFRKPLLLVVISLLPEDMFIFLVG
jgi:hypothetical protein